MLGAWTQRGVSPRMAGPPARVLHLHRPAQLLLPQPIARLRRLVRLLLEPLLLEPEPLLLEPQPMSLRPVSLGALAPPWWRPRVRVRLATPE